VIAVAALRIPQGGPRQFERAGGDDPSNQDDGPSPSAPDCGRRNFWALTGSAAVLGVQSTPPDSELASEKLSEDPESSYS